MRIFPMILVLGLAAPASALPTSACERSCAARERNGCAVTACRTRCEALYEGSRVMQCEAASEVVLTCSQLTPCDAPDARCAREMSSLESCVASYCSVNPRSQYCQSASILPLCD